MYVVWLWKRKNNQNNQHRGVLVIFFVLICVPVSFKRKSGPKPIQIKVPQQQLHPPHFRHQGFRIFPSLSFLNFVTRQYHCGPSSLEAATIQNQLALHEVSENAGPSCFHTITAFLKGSVGVEAGLWKCYRSSNSCANRSSEPHRSVQLVQITDILTAPPWLERVGKTMFATQLDYLLRWCGGVECVRLSHMFLFHSNMLTAFPLLS